MVTAQTLNDPAQLRKVLLSQIDNSTSVERLVPLLEKLVPLLRVKALLRDCLDNADACSLRTSYLCSASLDQVLPSALLCHVFSFLDSPMLATLLCLSKSITRAIQRFPALVFRDYSVCLADRQAPLDLADSSSSSTTNRWISLHSETEAIIFRDHSSLLRTNHRLSAVFAGLNDNMVRFGDFLVRPKSQSSWGGWSKPSSMTGEMSTDNMTKYLQSHGYRTEPLSKMFIEDEKERIETSEEDTKEQLCSLRGTSVPWRNIRKWYIRGTGFPITTSGFSNRQGHWEFRKQGLMELDVRINSFSWGSHTGRVGKSHFHSSEHCGFTELPRHFDDASHSTVVDHPSAKIFYDELDDSDWKSDRTGFFFESTRSGTSSSSSSSSIIETIGDESLVSSLEDHWISISDYNEFDWIWNQPSAMKIRGHSQRPLHEFLEELERDMLNDQTSEDDSADDDDDDDGGETKQEEEKNSVPVTSSGWGSGTSGSNPFSFGGGNSISNRNNGKPIKRPLHYQSKWLDQWLIAHCKERGGRKSAFSFGSIPMRTHKLGMNSKLILEHCLYFPTGKESLMDPFKDVMFTEDTEESTAVTASSEEYSALVTVSWDSSVYSVGWALDGLRSLRMWHSFSDEKKSSMIDKNLKPIIDPPYHCETFTPPTEHLQWLDQMRESFEKWKKEEMLPKGLSEMEAMMRAGGKHIRSLVIRDPPPNFRVMLHWPLPLLQCRHLRLEGQFIDDCSKWIIPVNIPELCALDIESVVTKSSANEFFSSSLERIKKIQWEPQLKLRFSERKLRYQRPASISRILKSFSYSESLRFLSLENEGNRGSNSGSFDRWGASHSGSLSGSIPATAPVWKVPKSVECLHISGLLPNDVILDLSECHHFVMLEVVNVVDTAIVNFLNSIRWSTKLKIECFLTDSNHLAAHFDCSKFASSRSSGVSTPSLTFSFGNSSSSSASSSASSVTVPAQSVIDRLKECSKWFLYRRWIVNDLSHWIDPTVKIETKPQGSSSTGSRSLFGGFNVNNSTPFNQWFDSDLVNEYFLPDLIRQWYPLECGHLLKHELMDKLVKMTQDGMNQHYPKLRDKVMEYLMKKMVHQKYHQNRDEMDRVWSVYQRLFSLKTPHWLFHIEDPVILAVRQKPQ